MAGLPVYRLHPDELARELKRRVPLRFVSEADDSYLGQVIEKARKLKGAGEVSMLWTWDAARGQTVESQTVEKKSTPMSLVSFLREIYSQLKRPEPPFDGWVWIQGPFDLGHEAAAWLKRVAERSEGRDLRVLVSGIASVPSELTSYAAPLDFSRPRNKGELDAALDSFVRDTLAALAEHATSNVKPIARTVQGLDAATIRRVLVDARDAALNGRDSGRDLVDRVRDARDDALSRSGVIEVKPVDPNERVGGLALLTHWLEGRGRLFHDEAAQKFRPRGVLLVGLPGCGKSLAARKAANLFGVPLLRLDMGRVMGRFVGESEANLRAATAAAEAAAPCVLWIDELEKAVGSLSDGSGGGVGQRLLGHLLTWMQESPRGVFLFATANNIDKLPPELLRRGRFDEMFMLDLPDQDERKEILAIHLERLTNGTFEKADMVELASAHCTGQFSGADLSALVESAVAEAHVRGVKFTTMHVLETIKAGFKPHAEQWKAQVDTMRTELTSHGFRRASLLPGERMPDGWPLKGDWPSEMRGICIVQIVTRSNQWTLQLNVSERTAHLRKGAHAWVAPGDNCEMCEWREIRGELEFRGFSQITSLRPGTGGQLPSVVMASGTTHRVDRILPAGPPPIPEQEASALDGATELLAKKMLSINEFDLVFTSNVVGGRNVLTVEMFERSNPAAQRGLYDLAMNTMVKAGRYSYRLRLQAGTSGYLTSRLPQEIDIRLLNAYANTAEVKYNNRANAIPQHLKAVQFKML